jgi:hypothetical protein
VTAVNNSDSKVYLDDVLGFIRELAQIYLDRHGSIPEIIVAVGGTALAAHHIRDASNDIDLYLSDVDDDIVAMLNKAGRDKFGPQFRLDVTPVNTIWGHMAIKDIEQSPPFDTIAVGGRNVVLRALTLETCYLLKAAAGRERDLHDLSTIAPHVTFDSVVQRANQTLGWVGDRKRLPEYLETLSCMLARDFGKSLEETDSLIAMPDAVRIKIAEMRRVRDARIAVLLERAIERAADTIRPNPDRPAQLIFDVMASGAAEQVRAIAASRPDLVTTVAARIMRNIAPERFKKWVEESGYVKSDDAP